MFGLLRTLVTLAVLVGFVWLGATVPLGQRTLFGHVENIWSSDEAQELVEGVKETSEPVVDRVKRGVEAGMRNTDDASADRDAPAAAH